MTKARLKLTKDIFQMVYNWGVMGMVVDFTSEAYQTSIGELVGNKLNGYHKVGTTTLKCFIDDCNKKHFKKRGGEK